MRLATVEICAVCDESNEISTFAKIVSRWFVRYVDVPCFAHDLDTLFDYIMAVDILGGI